MQCGAACLGTICSFFGQTYSFEQLAQICPATTEGVSLFGIKEAAHELGLKTVSCRLSVEMLNTCKMPCILHWNQNHFVVLYKIKHGERYYIADSRRGKVVYSRAEFEKHWLSTCSDNLEKGIAMFFEPTIEFGEKKELIQREHHSHQILRKYIKQYRKYYLHIVLGLFFGSILQLILPFLTQSIVDIGIANSNIHFIWLILLGEMMIVLGKTATDFIRRRLIMHISMRINIALVSDFFIKLLKLPMSFFDTKLMGDLLQRIGDHNRVQSFLTNQTLNVFFSSINFIVFGCVLFFYDRQIFSIYVTGSFLYGFWITGFLRRRKIIDYELFEKQSINQNKTYQFINSMQEIKLQDCEKRRLWEWEDVQIDLFNIQLRSLKLQQIQEAGGVFINEIKNVIITVLAATAVINGEMTLGMMLAVQYIIGQLNSPIEQFASFIYSFQDVKISLERINEIHHARNETGSGNQKHTLEGQTKSIIIDSIDFKYDQYALNKTLDKVSFSIPAGKVTAIVGGSGSGKTTLVKLMLGYYPVSNGEIKVAGFNINDYDIKWWRQQCGVVMQDGVIFSESIARNIAIDDNEIDVDRLVQAAEIANIHKYIMSLPLKYNTHIGRDGIGLSQGQKQRILIARAVYKNPDFIFLDEATNALDANNERTIVQNLNKFYKGRTVVIVAHRLSTVKNADNIVVLDAGRVVEIGNHQSLIMQKRKYYHLVRNQLDLDS